MKTSIHHFILFLGCLLWQLGSKAQTITTGTVTGSPFCPGASVAVPFTLSGVSIGPGNVFTAQLSDASGSFASPVNIGTGLPPTINATIPIGTASGTGYRVRVTSSNQPVTGSPNTSNLVIGSSSIGVLGNGISIMDGDATPSSADFTDFASTAVGNNIVRTFTITNSGASSLPISSITVSGADASLFTVGALSPVSPIAPGGSATFNVTFAPTSAGTKTATININNSSCNVAVYDFAVQGTATAPVINILAAQGFESGACDNWSSTGVTVNTETAKDGTRSGRVGRCGESATGTFNAINTSGYANLKLTIYHSVRTQSSSGNGEGFDTREGVVVQVKENNSSTWTTIGKASGNNNTSWGWNAATGGGGTTCTTPFSMPNPLVYNVTAGTTSLQFRVIAVNFGNMSSGAPCSAGCSSSAATCCANFENAMNSANPTAKFYDRGDEGFYIDAVTLTTTSPMPIVLTSAAGTDAQTACINNAITNITYSVAGPGPVTVTGLPAGVTSSYSGGIVTISGSPTTTVGSPFTYTVTSVCTGNTTTGTITVKPLPTISLTSAVTTSSQSVCSNTAIANITYSIGGSATGANVTGLPAGITGAYNAGVFTISGTPTVTGTFNYTVTSSGGCTPQATATGSIVIKPDATINLTSAGTTTAQSICINTALTNITYSVGGGGTSAGVTGLPAGITGTYNAGVFTISGTPTVAGTFNYTVTTTGTCVQAIATGTVTVAPDATITLGSAPNTDAQSLCINNPITAISYTIGGTGTGAAVSGLPAGVVGIYNAGVFTISGTPTVGGIFNYTVTATGTCGQATATGTIQVNADATIALSSATGTDAQSICIGTAVTNIVYSITGTGNAATVSGLPAGMSGTYNAGVFTISGAPTVAGTFNYTVTATGSCAQATAIGSITVNPDAVISLTSAAGSNAQTVCANTSITGISYTVAGGGTGATVSGLPSGITGSFNAGVFTISGTPTVTGVFNYTVATTGSCAQATATGSITVSPNASISLTSIAGTDAQAVCINTAVTPISYTIAGGGSGASITGLPAGVNGTYNAGVFTISGIPTVAGVFNYTVSTIGSCAQVTATGSITVNPDAVISLTSAVGSNAQTVCVNTAITNIAYAVTGGGTGTSVTGLPSGLTGSFNAGVFTISGTPTAVGSFNYTVSTTGSCAQAIATGSITVNPNASIALTSVAGTDAQTVCASTAITPISYAIAGGGSGAGITGLPAGVNGVYSAGVFTISGTPTVAGTFNYTVTTTGTCGQSTAIGSIVVKPNVSIALTSFVTTTAQSVCINIAISNIVYTITDGTGAVVTGLPAGITGSYNAGVFTISGIPTATGTFNYTVTATGSCAQAIVTGSITVNPNASIALTSATGTDAQTVCVNTAITPIAYAITGGGSGATITGLPNGVNGTYNAGVFTINGTPTVSGIFNYTISTTGACQQANISGSISVDPNVLPTISIVQNPNTIVCPGTTINFTATITNGGNAPSYQWKKNGMNVGSNAGSYSDNGLITGDIISCVLTSNAPCANPVAVTSNTLTITTGGPIAQVTGNGISIADGSLVPTTADNTDFGNVYANSTVTQTFTIKNTGVVNLVITNIAITGADAALFTLGTLTPSSPIAPGGTATFTVSFSPVSVGLQKATISIFNNTCNNGVHDFAIQGTGMALPAAALDFDGTDDYIRIPHHALLKPASQITIEAWVNPRDIHTNTYYEVYRKEDGVGRQLFSFQEHGTILSFGLGIGTAYAELDVPINKADFENQWVHIAATYDGKTKKVYRNGILIGSVNATGAIIATGSSPALIGQNQQQPEYFNGKIDEVRLWARALCQTEIQQTMNCELALPQNALIAYYKFNQGFASVPNPSVTTLLDASGNNLDGTLMNFSLASSTSNWVAPGGVVTGTTCSPSPFPLLTPSVVIASSATGAVCSGSSIVFTATPTNGGTAPSFIWKKNGVVIAGETLPTYTSNTLLNNDVITCVLTSSETCVTTSTANSNAVQVTVTAPVTPTFTAMANVCQHSPAPLFPVVSNNGIAGTWSPVVSTATVGTATYMFTPATGQCATTTNMQLTVDAPIIPLFVPIAPLCQNVAAPTLPLTSTNGVNGTWSPNIVTTIPGTSNHMFTPAIGQCAATVNMPITVNPLPTLTVSPLISAVCLGNSTPLQATSNGTIQWQGFGAGVNNINVAPTANATYQVTATSAAGCTATGTASVNVQDRFELNISVTPNPATKGENIKFTTSSAAAYQIIAWQPSALFPNQTASSQTIVANNGGIYYAVAKSTAGCTDTAFVDVEVITINNDLFVPNFFSPNNDGKNDVLKVLGTSIRNVEMRVFNQWGEMVFETKDKDRGWDGTQSGKQQPVGVYIYVAKVTLLNGRAVTMKGSVSLIR